MRTGSSCDGSAVLGRSKHPTDDKQCGCLAVNPLRPHKPCTDTSIAVFVSTYVVLNVILMNLLIALMTDTYQESLKAEVYCAWCTLQTLRKQSRKQWLIDLVNITRDNSMWEQLHRLNARTSNWPRCQDRLWLSVSILTSSQNPFATAPCPDPCSPACRACWRLSGWTRGFACLFLLLCSSRLLADLLFRLSHDGDESLKLISLFRVSYSSYNIRVRPGVIEKSPTRFVARLFEHASQYWKIVGIRLVGYVEIPEQINWHYEAA